jgi:hypothetical protein
MEWIDSICVICHEMDLEKLRSECNLDSFIDQPSRIEYILVDGFGEREHTDRAMSFSFNHLLKLAIEEFKPVKDFDILVVHDLRMTYINEHRLRELVLEAIKHGVSTMASDSSDTEFMFRVAKKKPVEVINTLESIESTFGGFLESVEAIRAGVKETCVDLTDLKRTYFPQAFQFSILETLLDNVCLWRLY